MQIWTIFDGQQGSRCQCLVLLRPHEEHHCCTTPFWDCVEWAISKATHSATCACKPSPCIPLQHLWSCSRPQWLSAPCKQEPFDSDRSLVLEEQQLASSRLLLHDHAVGHVIPFIDSCFVESHVLEMGSEQPSQINIAGQFGIHPACLTTC